MASRFAEINVASAFWSRVIPLSVSAMYEAAAGEACVSWDLAIQGLALVHQEWYMEV